jgi:integrase
VAVFKHYSAREKRNVYKVYVERDDATGKRKRRFVGTYKLRKEADKAERDALDARERGIDLAPDKITVAELLDRWQRDRKARNIGQKTMHEDEAKIRLHIKPRIGNLPLSKLRPAHLSGLYTDLAESGRDERYKAKRGLSAKTVGHDHGIIHAALEWGVQMQLVHRNVAKSVKPPKVKKSPAQAMPLAAIEALFARADQTPLGILFRLPFLTAARRGELLALLWDDVDFEARRLFIRASLSEIEGVRIFRKETKSDRERVVPLSPTALSLFQKQRAVQAAEKAAAGERYDDQGYVFADPLGGFLVPSWVSERWRELRNQAGVKGRMHDARHTAATAMFIDGVDPITVAGILGHASPSTTTNIYGHLIDRARDGAVSSIERYMEEKS